MKTSPACAKQNTYRRISPAIASPVVLGLFVSVLFVQSLAAADRSFVSSPPLLPLEARAGLGVIGITTPAEPAACSYGKSQGRIDSAGDRAGMIAGKLLEQTGSGATLAGLGVALAPVGALLGAIGAQVGKVSPEALTESEADLAQAMEEMGDQAQLRDHFLKAAREKTRRTLVLLPQSDPCLDRDVAYQPATDPGVQGVLEIATQVLRLQRMTSSDASFALTIKARARLRRADDGALLYDQPFEYRSGTGLFIDWTLNRAEPFRKVAQTGYRKVAERMVDQLFVATADGPLLIGSGTPAGKKKPARLPASPVLLAANQSGPAGQSSLRFAQYSALSLGTIGVFSSPPSHVAIRRPLTKDDAVREAQEDVERMLEGLTAHSNPVVALMAYGAAVPLSLCKQTTGAIKGLSKKKFKAADAALTSASQRQNPSDELGLEVAHCLSARGAQPVVLLWKPSVDAVKPEFVPASYTSGYTVARLPRTANACDYLAARGIGASLEIQVHRASLAGKDGVNPPLALHVDARAVLLRVPGGHELDSFPVQYRSRKHKFTEWAANDAELFRQELDRCYRELSAAMVEQVAARWPGVAPGVGRDTILADTPSLR